MNQLLIIKWVILTKFQAEGNQSFDAKLNLCNTDRMKPTLQHRPNSEYAYEGIRVKFEKGEPLTADQLNFLYNFEKYLSAHHQDSFLKFYLNPYYRHHSAQESFLIHGDTFNLDTIKHLKKRIHALIDAHKHPISFHLKPDQFLAFRAATTKELILFHGNHFLTGAPFFPGGVPHVIYFQWGNLFGVAKYAILAEEHAVKGNVFIYFEDMHERLLTECVHTYQSEHLIKPQPTPPLTPKPIPQPAPKPNIQSPFSIPKLTLARFQSSDDTKSKR